MRAARADQTHFNGAQRCALMQQCFQEAKDRRLNRSPHQRVQAATMAMPLEKIVAL